MAGPWRGLEFPQRRRNERSGRHVLGIGPPKEKAEPAAGLAIAPGELLEQAVILSPAVYGLGARGGGQFANFIGVHGGTLKLSKTRKI